MIWYDWSRWVPRWLSSPKYPSNGNHYLKCCNNNWYNTTLVSQYLEKWKMLNKFPSFLLNTMDKKKFSPREKKSQPWIVKSLSCSTAFKPGWWHRYYRHLGAGAGVSQKHLNKNPRTEEEVKMSGYLNEDLCHDDEG